MREPCSCKVHCPVYHNGRKPFGWSGGRDAIETLRHRPAGEPLEIEINPRRVKMDTVRSGIYKAAKSAGMVVAVDHASKRLWVWRILGLKGRK